jgi:hypothetical protein
MQSGIHQWEPDRLAVEVAVPGEVAGHLWSRQLVERDAVARPGAN